MIYSAAPRTLALSIETAIAGGSIVLSENGKVLGQWIGKGEHPQGEEVLERIAALLQTVGRSFSDITEFAVSAGPGSFTGIRIGMSTALGLARGSGKRLVTVDLFEAISFSSGLDGSHMIHLPMSRNKVVSCLFHGSNSAHIDRLPIVVERTHLAELPLLHDPETTHLFHSSLAEYLQGAFRTQDIGYDMAGSVSKYLASPGLRETGPIFLSGKMN